MIVVQYVGIHLKKMSLIMRVDGKFNMQEVNCISIFLDQFCESIYVKSSIALSLPRQSSLVPQCKMAFNRYTRNPQVMCRWGGGHLTPLSYRILIYRKVNRFNFFFCITQRSCFFATLFIWYRYRYLCMLSYVEITSVGQTIFGGIRKLRKRSTYYPAGIIV